MNKKPKVDSDKAKNSTRKPSTETMVKGDVKSTIKDATVEDPHSKFGDLKNEHNHDKKKVRYITSPNAVEPPASNSTALAMIITFAIMSIMGLLVFLMLRKKCRAKKAEVPAIEREE